MEGNLAAIQKDEATCGLIPPNIKEAIGLTPDASRLTPHLQPKVVIWGTGTPRREFLYSDDMAAACLYLLALPEEAYSLHLEPCNFNLTPLINIGSGEDLTIRELAELVREAVGFTGSLTFDSAKPDGTMQKLLDVSRMNQMGWKATTPLRGGIATAYKDYSAKSS